MPRNERKWEPCEVGKRLDEVLATNNMTIYALAQKLSQTLNTSPENVQNNITRIRKGEQARFSFFIEIAKVLKTSLNYLAGLPDILSSISTEQLITLLLAELSKRGLCIQIVQPQNKVDIIESKLLQFKNHSALRVVISIEGEIEVSRWYGRQCVRHMQSVSASGAYVVINGEIYKEDSIESLCPILANQKSFYDRINESVINDTDIEETIKTNQKRRLSLGDAVRLLSPYEYNWLTYFLGWAVRKP